MRRPDATSGFGTKAGTMTIAARSAEMHVTIGTDTQEAAFALVGGK